MRRMRAAWWSEAPLSDEPSAAGASMAGSLTKEKTPNTTRTTQPSTTYGMSSELKSTSDPAPPRLPKIRAPPMVGAMM